MAKTKYDKYTNDLGVEQITKTDENGVIWYVPADPANSDYQAYLASIEE